MGFFRSKKYPYFLFVIYVIAFLWSAYKPLFLSDFILESFLALFFVAFLFFTRKAFPLSNLSYTLIFVYLLLHTLGAHYTYSEVPFGFWLQDVFDFSRNHYDRIVHFSFGLLLAYPIREFFMRIVNAKGFWSYYLPFDVTASFSALYEIIEWFAVLVLGGDLGVAYLGTQGDIWDAQKDMALAITGALITMFVTFFINWKYKKGFGKEIAESFNVKRKAPLGEVALRKMMKN